MGISGPSSVLSRVAALAVAMALAGPVAQARSDGASPEPVQPIAPISPTATWDGVTGSQTGWAGAPAAPPPRVPPPAAWAAAHYADQKRNEAAAFVIELFPGAGSLYADDAGGAAVTWGLLLGGLGGAVLGVSMLGPVDPEGMQMQRRADSPAAMPLILAGTAVAIAGRIYGFVNAVRATARYNQRLRVQLGVEPRPSGTTGATFSR